MSTGNRKALREKWQTWQPTAPKPLRAPASIDDSLRILVGSIRHVIRPEKLVLGGGGLLEALWSHRVSTDIDLFVSNREIISVMGHMKKEDENLRRVVARLNRIGDCHIEGKEARGALMRGSIHDVEFSIYPSDILSEHVKRRRKVQGTAIRWCTVEEAILGKVGERWTKGIEQKGPEWVPPIRDVYDIAVGSIRDKQSAESAIAGVGQRDRAMVGEALEQVAPETLEEDPKGLLRPTYEVDVGRAIGAIKGALEGRHGVEAIAQSAKRSRNVQQRGPSRWE